MKTNEVEKLLGITKDTLRFYEKEKLILPRRDQNGYRNYSSEDIRLLKIILFFRSMEISVDDIKLLLEDHVSVWDVLKKQQDNLKNEIEQKKQMIDIISETLARKKAYFGYLSIPNEYQNEISVCFQENKLVIYDYYINHKYIEFGYHQIDKIKLSICTRISSNVIKDNKLTNVERFSVGLPTYFYVDLDIKINQTVYQYESLSLDNMHNISFILCHLDHVDDPLGLLNIFQKNTNINNINKILLSNLKNWESQYHVDNPRNFEIGQQVEDISKNIRKKNISLKDVMSETKILIIKKTIISLIIVAIFALFYFLLGGK